MLRSEHSIVKYERGRAFPDRLTRVTHRHYLDYAQRMLAVYRSGIGRARRELHRSIGNILSGEPDCPPQRIAALCKVLDDAGEFETDRRGEAAALRLRVFSLASGRHPLVSEPDRIFERSRREAISDIAAELGRPWEEIDNGLYIDVLDHQPLRRFESFATPEALLSAYNLAQLQACHYRARHMVVDASDDFAAIIRYAKLARLLLKIRRVAAARYEIELTGPASALHETRRYGIQFARFVGALVACRGWSARAALLTPWGTTAALRISSADGYRSHVASPAEFDSQVEEALARSWGECREGWRLLEAGGILHSGQSTFVPDFLLRHEDGREAFLEIVGFWTPEYLEAKRKTLALFRDQRILLAVPKRTAGERPAGKGVVLFGTRIKPEEVVRAVNASFAASTG